MATRQQIESAYLKEIMRMERRPLKQALGVLMASGGNVSEDEKLNKSAIDWLLEETVRANKNKKDTLLNELLKKKIKHSIADRKAALVEKLVQERFTKLVRW